MYTRVTGILLAILFLSGCSSLPGATFENVQASTPTSQSPAPMSRVPSATPDAVLTRVEGEVHLQQFLTGQLVLASFGDYLWRGDVIVTKQDAQAEAMCSDGQSIRVSPDQSMTVTCGETPDPICQGVIVRIHRERVEVLPAARPAALDYGNLPVILSPRNTRIAEGRPAIRWLAVEGAEDYEVVVLGPKGELWRAETQELELPYPAEQPALEAGVRYLIQVTARMGLAEPPRPSETVLVTVLSTADAEQVCQFEARVEALGLSVESARFFLAAYYVDQELHDAAIAQLLPLVEVAPSPPVHRLLGYAYLAVGLDGEAARSYQEARTLAQAQGNWLVQAEAEVGLGRAECVAGNFEQALAHYQAAQTLYQAMGLESNAEAVAERAAEAAARIPTSTP
jgi:hypothetical protein